MELVKIEVVEGGLFVSSRIVANALGKEHYDVKRKINEVLDNREFSVISYVDESNRSQEEYMLTKDGFILLCMNYQGYNDFKRAYIAEFNRMEAELKNATPAIPNFADPAEAAIAWAEQYRLAQNAIATKAEIGSRREATAMNTASQAVKQAKRLEIELDRSKEYASVKAVEALTKQKFNWRPLRNYCTANELDMKKIHDANYGAVNTYPAEAWQEVYSVHLCELF